MNTETIAELKEKARAVRLGIIDALGIDKRGHLGGSLSCADIVAALYFCFCASACPRTALLGPKVS